MAREKKEKSPESSPAWLITFSDLMTLLLTFFVLLVSMAVIDERNKLVVLGSVSTSFGLGLAQFNPKSPENKTTKLEPGALAETDMQTIKNILWEDTHNDLDFQENRYVQILSINSEVLFKPGETVLSDKGIVLLDRMLPYLINIRYPLLVAGHTANRRDEEGEHYMVSLEDPHVNSTWPLSLARALVVYRHLLDRGMPSSRLTQEAFGEYHPRFPDKSPEGRLMNRRVDLVLDKRNAPEILRAEEAKEKPKPSNKYWFRDFHFDLGTMDAPGGRR